MNNNPDTATIAGLVLRTLIASAAGGLIARGQLSPADVETLTGGALILMVGAWSWTQKKFASRKLTQKLLDPNS
jgi:hypothetical protein